MITNNDSSLTSSNSLRRRGSRNSITSFLYPPPESGLIPQTVNPLINASNNSLSTEFPVNSLNGFKNNKETVKTLRSAKFSMENNNNKPCSQIAICEWTSNPINEILDLNQAVTVRIPPITESQWRCQFNIKVCFKKFIFFILKINILKDIKTGIRRVRKILIWN